MKKQEKQQKQELQRKQNQTERPGYVDDQNEGSEQPDEGYGYQKEAPRRGELKDDEAGKRFNSDEVRNSNEKRSPQIKNTDTHQTPSNFDR